MTQTAIKEVTGEIVPNQIAVYNPFRAQIAEMHAINKKTVFNYADPKGNKEARSYLYRLRQSKSAIEKARKEEKAASLEYGRRVDTEAKELIGEIDAMIEVHAKPIEEIEQREKARIDAIRARIDRINALLPVVEGSSAESILSDIVRLQELVIDNSFAELQLEASKAKEIILPALRDAHDKALKREAEAAELERLRQEKIARDKQDYEDRLKREAAEQARLEAEAKAQREKDEIESQAKMEREAAEQRERDLKRLADQAEQEKQAALQREQDAIEKERQRVQLEADAKAAVDALREADEKHKQKVHGDIIEALVKYCGFDELIAIDVIMAIRLGHIPNVKIIY